MMNKHGLSRHIPAALKRELRKHCGFGCAICGSPLFDYEHFEPPFAVAREHRFAGMTLLCPTCHRKKANGLIPVSDIASHAVRPFTHTQACAAIDWVDHCGMEIRIRKQRFLMSSSVVKVDGMMVLGFDPPEAAGASPRLTFRAFDRHGTEVLRIRRNQIELNSAAGDIVVEGRKWTVRSELSQIDLELEMNPPDSIDIKRLHFRCGRFALVTNGEYTDVVSNGGVITSFPWGGPEQSVVSDVYLHLSENPSSVVFRDSVTLTSEVMQERLDSFEDDLGWNDAERRSQFIQYCMDEARREFDAS